MIAVRHVRSALAAAAFPHRRFGLVANLCGALLIAMVLPRTALAEFPVCVAHGDQLNVTAIPDGQGGAYVAWKDGRNGSEPNVFVMRFKSDGQPASGWPANGKQASFSLGPDAWPRLALDGAGGVFVAWGITAFEFRGQRFGIDGNPVWPPGGVLLNGPLSSMVDASYTSIAEDGTGRLFAAWSRAPEGRAFLSLTNADGTRPVGWSDPIDVSGSLRSSNSIAVVPDPTGGVFVLRSARSPEDPGATDLFVRHFTMFATPYPEPNAYGRLVSAVRGAVDHVQAVADGAGGVYVAWDDTRDGSADVYVTRLDALGMPRAGWPDSGLALAARPGTQSRPRLVRTADGGAIVAWTDRGNGLDDDIRITRLDASGALAPGWPAEGLLVATGERDQTTPAIALVSDASVYVAWATNQVGAFDVRAMRVLGVGTPAPGNDGAPVAIEAPYAESDPVIVALDDGATMVIWRDYRAGEIVPDLYGSRLDIPITLDAPGARGASLALHGAQPNPARVGALRFAFTLPDAAPATLELFDASGRRLAARDVGGLGAGRHTVAFERLAGLPPGLVFARLARGGEARTARVAVVR